MLQALGWSGLLAEEDVQNRKLDLNGSEVWGKINFFEEAVFVEKIRDLSDNLFIHSVDIACRRNWGSFLWLPIRSHSTIVGFLEGYEYGGLATFSNKQKVNQILGAFANQIASMIEQGELNKRLREISELVLTTDSFGDLAQYIVNAAADLTGSDVNLWMMSEEEAERNQYLRIVASKSKLSKEFIRSARLPISPEESINVQALQQQRSFIREDVINDSEKPGFYYYEEAKRQGWHSFMAVPIIGRGKVSIGVLTLYDSAVDKFSKTTVELIQAFANQTAIAFQQQKRNLALQQLSQVGQKLTESMTGRLQLLSKEVAEVAQKLMQADCVVLYPYDPVRKQFYEKDNIAGKGLKYPLEAVADKPRKGGLAALIRQVGILVVHSLDNGEIEVPGGLRDNSEIKYSEILHIIRNLKFINRENIKAFLGISLRASESPKNGKIQTHEVGILYINYRSPYYFTEEELQIIKVYSHQVANVIQSARLYKEAQNSYLQLKALNDTFLDIVSQLDIKKLMSAIINRAASLMAGETYKGIEAAYWRYDYKTKKAIIDYCTIPKLKGIEINSDESLLGIVLSTARTQYKNNFHLWEGRGKVYNDKLLSHLKNIIEVPVKIYGLEKNNTNVIVGVIAIMDSTGERYFKESDIEVLERFASVASIALQNAQFIKREITLREQSETLREISNVISSDLSIEEVAGRILDELGKVVEFRKATVQLIIDDERKLIAFRGFENAHIDDWLLRPISEDKLVSRIKDGMVPIILSEVLSDPDWEIREFTTNIKSWVGVPLVYGREILGLITLDHDVSDFYKQDQKKLLKLYANQAAIAIKNAILFDETKRQLRDLEIIEEIVKVMNSEPESDLQNILQMIVEQIANNLDCTHCTIFLSQENKGRLLLKPEVTYGPRSQSVLSRRFVPGNGVAGWVFREGKSVLLDDAKSDLRYASARDDRDSHRSMLVVPVKVGDITIGVISIDQDEFGWFSENDQRLLEAIAHHIGIAIERDRLRHAQLDAVRREYVQDVAHQLVGPLAGLRANAENLLEGRVNVEKGKTILKTIVDQAGLIQRYAENLSFVARGGDSIFSSAQFRPSKFTAEELIRLLIKYSSSFQGQAKTKRLIGPSVDEISFRRFPPLMLDESLFEILMLNLYDNAVKYSYEAAPITTTGHLKENIVEIEVSSHGIPLTEDDISQIFKRYTRSKMAMEYATIGTGIGLYICNQIVKLHGGTIRAIPSRRSIYGNEVKFIITLPIKNSHDTEEISR